MSQVSHTYPKCPKCFVCPKCLIYTPSVPSGSCAQVSYLYPKCPKCFMCPKCLIYIPSVPSVSCVPSVSYISQVSQISQSHKCLKWPICPKSDILLLAHPAFKLICHRVSTVVCRLSSVVCRLSYCPQFTINASPFSILMPVDRTSSRISEILINNYLIT